MSSATFHGWETLNRGITVLEASAGTGKTYQITNIALRLITEERVDISDFLIMTFTRAATAELKGRVRGRLVEAMEALSSDCDENGDEFIREFRAKAESLGLTSQYTGLLRDAIANFDQACIATIHSFCQRMLQQNAFEAATPPNLELVKDVSPIIEDIVGDTLSNDLYSATSERYLELTTESGWGVEKLTKLAEAATKDQTMTIRPEAGDDSDRNASDRANFARSVRLRLKHELSRRGQMSYNDLLHRLSEPLQFDADPDIRRRLTKAIGDQFKVVLLDEFQDTDQLQWSIFEAAFASGNHYLYLIGDPKQAIYSFRGANIHVYIAAKEKAAQSGGDIYTMKTNHRSDEPLVASIGEICDHTGFFGSDKIQYIPVNANHKGSRIDVPTSSGVGSAPLQVRLCDTTISGEEVGGWFPSMSYEASLIELVVDDIVRDLSAGIKLTREKGGDPALAPGDIAVLVNTNAQAAEIKRLLVDRGVPAIASSPQSVFESDESRHLQHWLEAIANPRDTRGARKAAATKIFGWTDEKLALVEANDQSTTRQWERWLEHLVKWNNEYDKKGFFQSLTEAVDSFGVRERLLGQAGGERALTNLFHLAELLHVAQTDGRLTLRALTHWLTERRLSGDKGDDLTEQRLETDEKAVNVMTMHKSKGLQFGVVFAPFLVGEKGVSDKAKPNLIVSDPNQPTSRILDLRDKKCEEKEGLIERASRDQRKESMRLLYVAFTRAKHRLITYFVAFENGKQSNKCAPKSAIASALFGSYRDNGESHDRLEDIATSIHQVSLSDLKDHIERIAPSVDVTIATAPQKPARRWIAPEASETTLTCAKFSRGPLDLVWSRYSYTSINRSMKRRSDNQDNQETNASIDEMELDSFDHDQSIASPELDTGGAATGGTNEDNVDNVPFAGFPAGATAGTFLHEIYEYLDFAADEDEVEKTVLEVASRHSYSGQKWGKQLSEWLHPTLHTPLGGPLGTTCLSHIPKDERLDELAFDFSLGDKAIKSRDFSAALAFGRSESCFPVDYATKLSNSSFNSMSGFFTGHIDLVFRAPVEGTERWFVADYKSNRLDPNKSKHYPLSNFTEPHMAHEMAHHNYHLQYVLYSLALHRYLRIRISNYEYESHFGGAYYLFFRGMVGQAGYGSYFRRPPKKLIDRLDSLFSEGK
jgi:exodeoxyribonuclease V beta subunit